MTRPESNIRYRLFGAIARLGVHRPWLVIAAAATLSVLCVLYTTARLEFHTGQLMAFCRIVTATSRNEYYGLRNPSSMSVLYKKRKYDEE
jgi:hypothetical protein